MPFNKIKKYNDLLELDSLSEHDRTQSLSNIFERDFISNTNKFKDKKITPTPIDGQSTMDTLFNHLTKCKDRSVDRDLSRVYDSYRSKRIHWIRFHFENTPKDICVFSIRDKEGIRTYIFNEKESYVIILEPKGEDYYFLITAYYLRGGDLRKMKNKEKRKLPAIY